jgi:glycosyltransferase involved in cell wall biosynthesis
MSKVLFLTEENPFPPRGSDKFRDLHILKLLCEIVDEVEVLCFAGEGQAFVQPPASELPKNLKITELPKRKEGFFHRLFRSRQLNAQSESIEEALEQRAEQGTLLWISRLLMASCVPLARSLGYRVVLDEHNVESALLKQTASRSTIKKIPNMIVAAQASYYESRFCLKSNAVVAASDIDARRLGKIAPRAPVHIIPNTVDHTHFASVRATSGSTLLFSGSLNHPTNVEGLTWFMNEIMPRLRARLGERMPKVVVAGANPTSIFTSFLESNGAQVHANPENMLPHYSDSSIVFVPIRSGGGTPLKILEAMSAGRAIVSTGKAIEGLVLAPTYDILIADSADGFTSAVLRLFDNPQLRTEMGAHAAQTVSDRYDWRRARETIAALLKSI